MTKLLLPCPKNKPANVILYLRGPDPSSQWHIRWSLSRRCPEASSTRWWRSFRWSPRRRWVPAGARARRGRWSRRSLGRSPTRWPAWWSARQSPSACSWQCGRWWWERWPTRWRARPSPGECPRCTLKMRRFILFIICMLLCRFLYPFTSKNSNQRILKIFHPGKQKLKVGFLFPVSVSHFSFPCTPNDSCVW